MPNDDISRNLVYDIILMYEKIIISSLCGIMIMWHMNKSYSLNFKVLTLVKF